jgi:hypothetical protein
MGNRAAIAFTDKQTRKPETFVYMHWNGGPESVYAILDVLHEKGRASHSAEYTTARFAHLACELIDGDGLSVGVMPFTTIDDAAHTADDNGLYVHDISTGKTERYVAAGFDKDARKLTLEETLREISSARAHEYWKGDSIRNTLRASIPDKRKAA